MIVETFKTIAEAIKFAKSDGYGDIESLEKEFNKNMICKVRAGCKDEALYIIDPYRLLD